MRVVLSGRTARAPIREALSAMPGVELVEADGIDEVVAQVATTDALILSDPRGPDGARLAEALHRDDCRVRWVQMVSAGYSGITSHRLPGHLVVTNQGGVMAASVAEHALALILALNRALPAAFEAQRTAHWAREDIRPRLRTLEGATVIVVGVGYVGGVLAKFLEPLAVNIVGVTRDGAARQDLERTVPILALDHGLAEADVVAICLPGSDETRGLFDARRLAAIKRGAILVNVGRGEVVDADALAAALMSGHLRGAALDVTDPEPLPHEHPLWRAPNLIVTPHVAGGGNPRAGRHIAQMVADNVGRFTRGEPLLHQIKLGSRP
jgi:phosphoglycerate dehydrogenase-like enzyme